MTEVAGREDLLRDRVWRGLAGRQKSLPPVLFYDDAGAALFDQITRLDAYYLTRAEGEILETRGRQIADHLAPNGEQVVVVELGCGDASKIGALLAHLPARAFVGVDLAAEALRRGTARLAQRFPGLEMRGVIGDYHEDLHLDGAEGRRVVCFLGSTIGNYGPEEAIRLLQRLRAMAGWRGAVLVGFDLWKAPETLREAYDDPQSVTARFNKNALLHLNRRFGATFDPALFDHVVRIDPERRRVEMHLRATRPHRVQVAGRTFRFASGETIHTESSHKYTVEDFRTLASQADLVPSACWTDAQRRFALMACRHRSRL